MKKVMFLLSALCVVAACVDNKNDSIVDEIEPAVKISLTKAQAEILGYGNDFAFDYFRAMSTAAQGKNCFVSPFSMQVALSMLANGAEGDTLDEIMSVLGYVGYDIEAVNGLYNTVLGGLFTVDKSTTLELANSAWLAEDLPVKEDYKNVLKTDYGASVCKLDFKLSTAASTVNKWCSDNTHGMISQMFDSIDPDTKVLLLNALFFKGVWYHYFPASETRKSDFYRENGNIKQLSFMHQTNQMNGFTTSSLQCCEIPYGNGGFVIDFLMPAKGTDFDQFVSGLDAVGFNNYLHSMYPLEVSMFLPKIEEDFSVSEEIYAYLRSRGCARIFANAQLGRMCELPLSVSMISQKARFSINETGAQASAVSEIEMLFGSPDPETVPLDKKMTFRADHPFVYIIREVSTGAILFAGTFRG